MIYSLLNTLLAGVLKENRCKRGKAWKKAKQQQLCNLLFLLVHQVLSWRASLLHRCLFDVPFTTDCFKDSCIFCPKCEFPFGHFFFILFVRLVLLQDIMAILRLVTFVVDNLLIWVVRNCKFELVFYKMLPFVYLDMLFAEHA